MKKIKNQIKISLSCKKFNDTEVTNQFTIPEFNKIPGFLIELVNGAQQLINDFKDKKGKEIRKLVKPKG